MQTVPLGLGWQWAAKVRGAGKKKRALAVGALLHLIETTMASVPEGGCQILWEADTPDAAPSLLDVFLEEVTLYHLPGVKKPKICAPLIGYAENQLSVEAVDLIAGKEDLRAESYVTRCDVCWLVLVATGVNRKSMVDLPEFQAIGLPEHGFERIYIFDQFSKLAKLLTKAR
ncbi:MAG: hypothetical protein HY271_03055 [Deltaproteobacteria bacterium]|nr:hypothetical protein [Deltaproteobacteria bacterium]